MNNTVMMLVRETNVSSLGINEAENNGVFRSLIMKLFYVTWNVTFCFISVDIGLSSLFTINNIDRELYSLKK